jgi:hypothetical protein
METINAKNDTSVEFQIVDETGTAILCNQFENVTAELINRKTGVIMDSFVLNSEGTIKNITVATTDTFRLWLEKEIWTNHVDGDLFISVVAYQINEELTGGVQRTGGIIELPKLQKND